MMKSTLTSILASTAAVVLTSLTAITGDAHASGDDWDKDWTALTVSHTGSWGTHTSPSRVEAMIGAMTQCREKAAVAGSGCGAHITTVRSAWSLAYACGSETFISTGSTYAEANAAAIHREIELVQIERIAIASCRRLVAIGPDGQLASSNMLSEIMPVIPEHTGAADTASKR